LVSELAESPEVEVATMASILRIRLLSHATSAALLFMAACAPPPSPDAGAHATSSGAGVPYVAINTRKQFYFPEARTRGTFETLRGCVIYRRAGDNFLFTPVFPAGSKITRQDSAYYVEVNGKRHRFGKEVILGGGGISLHESAEVSLARMPPASCPSPVWLVSEVEER